MSHTQKVKKNKINKTRKNLLIKKNNTNNSIILFTPNKAAIELANKDTDKYLFHDKVDYNIALNQYEYFKNILKQQGQNIIDISNYVPNNTPIKYYTNLLYTRDPFIKTPKGIILGRMREPIRKHDTELLEKIMNKFKQPIVYKCEKGEFLEGGDFSINGDTSFIGIGERTNINAAKKLLKLNLYGTKKVVIIYPVKLHKNMYTIHLDCMFLPFGNKQCVIWDDLSNPNSKYKRLAIEYTLQENGNYKKSSKELNLVDYLKDNDYNLITISNESQKNYGANILELNNGNILVQDKETHKKIKGSIFIPFNEIHKMYGGLHCATNSFF